MWKRLIAAVPLALIGAAWFYYLAMPWPILLRVSDPGTTAVMRQRMAEARTRGEDLEVTRQWMPLNRISPRLQRAVIVAEDGRFRDHDGIDWLALREEFRYQGDADFSWFDGDDRRALLASVRYYRDNRDKVRGRSTITQQLAKNLYYSTDRSLIRKLEEFIVARRIERFLSKDRILEVYLNVVEWGPGIFGAEAAAQHYFSRSAADLTLEQAAALAATLPHPLTSNPKLRPGRMEWRRNLILGSMGGAGPVQTVPLGPDAPLTEPSTDDPLGAPIGAPVDTAAPPPDTARPPPDTARPPDPARPPPDTAHPLDTPRPPPDTARPAAMRVAAGD
jgi:monofunctional glycosyltransferase